MNRIALLRKKKNMTQKELADKLDISSVTLSRYETEARTPSINTVKKMADFFKVSMEYLMGETENDKMVEALDQVVSATTSNVVKTLNQVEESLNDFIKNMERRYIGAFTKLNDEGAKELFKYSDYLATKEEYKGNPELLEIRIRKPSEKNKDDSEDSEKPERS